jgi:hypothetical protein
MQWITFGDNRHADGNPYFGDHRGIDLGDNLRAAGHYLREQLGDDDLGDVFGDEPAGQLIVAPVVAPAAERGFKLITFGDSRYPDGNRFFRDHRGIDFADNLSAAGRYLRDDLGSDERYKPLLADYITESELASLISQPVSSPPKVAAVDLTYRAVARAILEAIKAGRLKLPKKAGDEDFANSFGNMMREWRRAVVEQAPLMDYELDLWRNRAFGWVGILRGRGVSVSAGS